MKSAIRLSLVVAIVAAFATTGFAALSQKYQDFGNGPAQWLMTKQEQAKWRSINSDADAQAFIDLFWARRDPTPGTAANEFRDEFDSRVALANQRFVVGRKSGAMSELGHVLVVLGLPTRMSKSDPMNASGATQSNSFGTGAIPGPAGNADDAVSGTAARQLWTWDRTKTTLPFDGPSFEVAFTDQFGNGNWQISRGKFDVSGLMNKMVEAAIVNPNLTEAPKYGETTRTTTTTTTTTTAAAAPVAAAPATGGLVTASLVSAVQAAKSAATPSKASVVFTQLVAPNGEFYTPIGIYVPKSAGLAPDAADTLFASVEDSTGKVVSSFEQPAKLFNSNGDLLADNSLALPSGKYTAVVGLAKAGQPVIVATRAIDVNEVAKDATGVSPMIISNNLAETADAAPIKSPFAFGKLKVVPKGNLVFSNKDDLSYFIEIHNPGIDPATNLPKLQAKLEIAGGKLKQPIAAPLSDAPALPLSGQVGPGQYAVANAIPLGQMTTPLQPGDYTLRVKLIDTITKQSYTAEQSFRIE